VRATRGEIVVFLDSDQRALQPCWLDPALAILRDNVRIGAVSWNAAGSATGPAAGRSSTTCPNVHDGPLRERVLPHRRRLPRDLGFAAPRSVLARTTGFDEFFDPTPHASRTPTSRSRSRIWATSSPTARTSPSITARTRPPVACREYSDLYKRKRGLLSEEVAAAPRVLLRPALSIDPVLRKRPRPSIGVPPTRAAWRERKSAGLLAHGGWRTGARGFRGARAVRRRDDAPLLATQAEGRARREVLPVRRAAAGEDAGVARGAATERVKILELGAYGVPRSSSSRRSPTTSGLRDPTDLRLRLPYPDEQFDVVLAMEVIEHVADLEYAHATRLSGIRHSLREVRRVLRVHGSMLLTTPNACSLLVLDRAAAARAALASTRSTSASSRRTRTHRTDMEIRSRAEY